jgi:hypothetical protein
MHASRMCVCVWCTYRNMCIPLVIIHTSSSDVHVLFSWSLPRFPLKLCGWVRLSATFPRSNLWTEYVLAYTKQACIHTITFSDTQTHAFHLLEWRRATREKMPQGSVPCQQRSWLSITTKSTRILMKEQGRWRQLRPRKPSLLSLGATLCVCVFVRVCRGSLPYGA